MTKEHELLNRVSKFLRGYFSNNDKEAMQLLKEIDRLPISSEPKIGERVWIDNDKEDTSLMTSEFTYILKANDKHWILDHLYLKEMEGKNEVYFLPIISVNMVYNENTTLVKNQKKAQELKLKIQELTKELKLYESL